MSFVKPSQLTGTKPGVWPIYYKLLIWIVVAAAVFFIYGYFFRKDLLDDQLSNQEEIVKLESQYEKLYQFSLDLPLYEEKKKILSTKLLALLDFLPTDTEMASLVDKIYDAAYKSNINFSQLTPQESISKEYYNIEPISLSTSTGFSNFASFVQYIGQIQRILNVRSFDLVMNQKTDDTLDVSSNLETYIYNKDISKYTGVNKGEK